MNPLEYEKIIQRVGQSCRRSADYREIVGLRGDSAQQSQPINSIYLP